MSDSSVITTATIFITLVFKLIFTEATLTEDFRHIYHSLQGFSSIDLRNKSQMFNLLCKISIIMPLYLMCKFCSNSINVPTNVQLVTKELLQHFIFRFISCETKY
jgi:hypothetical protein